MASRGANNCLKLFLIVVNLLFLLLGLAILGLGIFLCTNADLGNYSDLMADVQTLRSVRYLLIIVGCFIALIGMCGCFGACKENTCLLVLYIIFLVLILIANCVAIGLTVMFNSKVKDYLVEKMEDQLKRTYGNTTTDKGRTFTNAVDAIQRGQSCCGWRSLDKPNLFPSTPWYAEQQKVSPGNPAQFPESCCVPDVLADAKKKESCVRPKNETLARRDGFIHAEDCTQRLSALNSSFVRAVVGVVVIAILMQIICLTCSVVIVRQIRNSDEGRVV